MITQKNERGTGTGCGDKTSTPIPTRKSTPALDHSDSPRNKSAPTPPRVVDHRPPPDPPLKRNP